MLMRSWKMLVTTIDALTGMFRLDNHIRLLMVV